MSNYKFIGWGTNSSVSNKTVITTVPNIQNNIKLYAKWDQAINVTFKDYNNTVIHSWTVAKNGKFWTGIIAEANWKLTLRVGYKFLWW